MQRVRITTKANAEALKGYLGGKVFGNEIQGQREERFSEQAIVDIREQKVARILEHFALISICLSLEIWVKMYFSVFGMWDFYFFNVMIHRTCSWIRIKKAQLYPDYLGKSTSPGRQLSFPSSTSQREKQAQRRLNNLPEITQLNRGNPVLEPKYSFSCVSIYV